MVGKEASGVPSFTTTVERGIVRAVKEKLCYIALAFNTGMNLPDGIITTVGSGRICCPEVLVQPSLVGKEASGEPSFTTTVESEGIKVDSIKPQVDRFIFPHGHGVSVLAFGRLLHLGCATASLGNFDNAMGIWKQIKAEGAYASFSWTVEADFPTVFLRGLLKDRLAQSPETLTGTYIETCNHVLMGYFGTLEVTSKTGLQMFLEQFDGYYVNGGKCWRWATANCKSAWNYGPWGEDLFMQRTMDDAEVMKKSDFPLMDTGTCPGMRQKADKDSTKL